MINLHPGTTYTMWVQAKTAQGVGKKATVTVTTKKPTPPKIVVPSAPRNVRATPGTRRVVVRWTVPAKNGGAVVSSYQVRVTSPGVVRMHTVKSNRTTLTVSGLKKGKAYAVRTRARNSAGWSTWSKAVTVRVR